MSSGDEQQTRTELTVPAANVPNVPKHPIRAHQRFPEEEGGVSAEARSNAFRIRYRIVSQPKSVMLVSAGEYSSSVV